MNQITCHNLHRGLSRIKLFLALSRTPHGLLDMATPGLCAILWLGAFPPAETIVLGLITAFAGYTAVYAFNDVVDYPTDVKKVRQGGFTDSENYLDGAMVRHPMAQGLLGFKAGVLWAAAWGLLAIIGAYLLNPVCVFIFLGGCALETVYCLMWRTSCLRAVVSGAVKTTGGIAAVFAVDPRPSPAFLSILFLWLFFWEIGGQNIPADWTDIEEDRRLDAKTIPVRFGPQWACAIIFGCLILAVVTNFILFWFTAIKFGIYYMAACLLAGLYLLIIPAYRLFRTQERQHVLLLFNKASYYPLALLVVVAFKALT